MAGRQIQGQGGRRYRLLTPHDLIGVQGSGSSGVQSITPGQGIIVDGTNPTNPKISMSGGIVVEGTSVSSPGTSGTVTPPGKILEYLKIIIGNKTLLVPAYEYLGENVFTSLVDYIKFLNPVAYWPLQESSGTTLTDVIGGEVLTLSGAYTLGSLPLVTNDARKSILFSGGMATGTASAKWSLGSGDISGVVVGRWTNATLATAFSIRDSGAGNILCVANCNRVVQADISVENWDWSNNKANSSPGYNNNVPHAISFNYVANTNALSLFIDGALAKTVICNPTRPNASTMLVHLASNFGSQNFLGNLQDLAFFSRQLTNQEHNSIGLIVKNGHT